MTQGSEKRERFRHLTIRLTLAERVAIDNAAECAGLTAGSYVRQTVLGRPVPRQMRRIPADHKELVRILGQLGHLGGNINQLAKASNTGEMIYGGELAQASRAVIDMRDAVLKALGRSP